MHGEQVRYAHKEERKKKNEEWWAGHPHPIITPLCHFATKGGVYYLMNSRLFQYLLYTL